MSEATYAFKSPFAIANLILKPKTVEEIGQAATISFQDVLHDRN
jgi:hypothetical protein